jgi:hypothetical protein
LAAGHAPAVGRKDDQPEAHGLTLVGARWSASLGVGLWLSFSMSVESAPSRAWFFDVMKERSAAPA